LSLQSSIEPNVMGSGYDAFVSSRAISEYKCQSCNEQSMLGGLKGRWKNGNLEKSGEPLSRSSGLAYLGKD
jgi:hypothetical protein